MEVNFQTTYWWQYRKHGLRYARGIKMEQVIRVKGLKKYFKDVKAVDDISFQVEKEELFGFLGVNGAGKSTTINMLCSLYTPTAGEVEICGFWSGREDESIRRKIGVVWQSNCLDDKLTVKENLYVRGSLYGQNKTELKESIDRVCERLNLHDIFNRYYEKLSGGQKRRCEIAAALVNTPEILFLDEPTTGLDPATRQLVWESLKLLQKEDGMTIFLTTHYMEEAARANHIAVMDGGKIKEFGTPFELKERFARDKLRLVPKEGAAEDLKEALMNCCNTDNKDKSMVVEWKGDTFLVTLPDSLSALPILKETESSLQGFEMVQGSMDDVFLNITGKNLE